ncbi:MAG TPA: cupredoxin domain-containing protein [Pyrinomonadaceae bacterium]
MDKLKVTSRVLIAFIVLTSLFPSRSVTAKPRLQTATVKITTRGYEPYVLKFRRGIRTRVTFVRTTDATCANEVVFPEFGIRRELPLNQPVAITLTPTKKGEFSFTCGMNMMRGKLIVQ